ncbi:MAG: hypothetical protein ACP5JJ_09585 [Anaerolineae bacterium]
MRRRAYFVLATTILWLAALGLVVRHAVDRLAVPAWGNTAGEARSSLVDADTAVGQIFEAPYPGLYRVEIWLEGGTAMGTVTLREEAGSEPGPVLQASSFGPDDLEEGMPYALSFEPLRTSGGREYILSIESSAAGEDGAFTAAYGPNTVLEGATATLNGNPIKGNLRFQTYYTLTNWEKLELLLARMAEGRPYFLGTTGFYAGLALAYTLLLAIFLWQIAGLVTGDRRGD